MSVAVGAVRPHGFDLRAGCIQVNCEGRLRGIPATAAPHSGLGRTAPRAVIGPGRSIRVVSVRLIPLKPAWTKRMKAAWRCAEQIIGILKEQEAGVPVAKLCRKHGMSEARLQHSLL